MVFLGGWAFLMSETTLYAHLKVVEVAKWSAAAWHNVLLITFRKSTPPHNRELNVLIGDNKQ